MSDVAHTLCDAARQRTLPLARVLGNGRYTTLVHAGGGGFSRWAGLALDDWNGDALEERGGLALYLRDIHSGELVGLQRNYLQPPAGDDGPSDRAVCEWAAAALTVRMEVCVAPTLDLESRRISVRNDSGRAREIELTTCFEVALAAPLRHADHPAFSKLFVQTAFLPEREAVLAWRRPRGGDEGSPCLIQTLAGPGLLDFETDRLRFHGRGSALPRALMSGAPLSRTEGNVLDPVAVLRRRVRLPAGSEAVWNWTLGASASRDGALALHAAAGRSSGFEGLAAACAAREDALLARLDIDMASARPLQRLAAGFYYGRPELGVTGSLAEQAPDALERVAEHGLPTDRPYSVVCGHREAPVVAAALKAQSYWRAQGLDCAMLYLANGDDLIEATRAGELGIVQRRLVDVPARDLALLRAVARLVVDGEERPPTTTTRALPQRQRRPRPDGIATEPRAPGFDNGHGDFSADGRAYFMRITADEQGIATTPAPWINVIANARFGCIVSETGAGCTWSGNSRERRLTPWSNDPVRDPHGEALYLRDEASGALWSPLPGPAGAPGDYEIEHALGYTRFRFVCDALAQETTVFVDRSEAIKFVRVRLDNRAARARRLALVSYARLVLGVLPALSSRHVRARIEPNARTLLAGNPLSGVFATGVVFAAAVSGDAIDWSAMTSREAFLGAGGDLANPGALAAGGRLAEPAHKHRDPCFAQQLIVALPPGARTEICFVLGEATGPAEALALVARLRAPGAVDAALAEVEDFWRETVSAVQVQTPMPALDRMINHWLPYQNLSCRLWGRTAAYQSSGAFGFRDQLQDAAALIHLRPDLTRDQILAHAARQFTQGDVMHWWHPAPVDRGLRTRMVDDRVWLPYVTAFYVSATGDRRLLDEEVPSLRAPELRDGETDAYVAVERDEQSASLYEHCCRALDRSLTRGVHGLPLMGTGDWNDGMNRVGREGRGESVWMAFFLYAAIGGFLPYCEQRGDRARLERYRQYRTGLLDALDTSGWDGAWYRRAYYDDGTPLGADGDEECRIDALVQAWSVISGAASNARANQAMDAVERHLIAEHQGIIRLLTPAFVDTPRDPGYIKGYVAGVRENGGQYTHAACWVVKALAELGRAESAARLLEMLCPPSHARTPADVARYKLEPYVVAADIYGEPPHVGRGGWSWYTGSAGWLYRVALESVLGITLHDGCRLRVKPCIPRAWPGYTVTWRLPASSTRYRIEVLHVAEGAHADLDGRELPLRSGAVELPLVDDAGEHHACIRLCPTPPD